MSESTVCVPIPTKRFLMVVDFLREVGSDRDPIETIDMAIDYWVQNASGKREDLLPELFETPPSQEQGYTWSGFLKGARKHIFLPHGTRVRMKYRREFHYAKVDGDQIVYQGQSVSPSEFANKVTNSSRNAWRDLWIKKPDMSQWVQATELRQEAFGLDDLLRMTEDS